MEDTQAQFLRVSHAAHERSEEYVTLYNGRISFCPFVYSLIVPVITGCNFCTILIPVILFTPAHLILRPLRNVLWYYDIA